MPSKWITPAPLPVVAGRFRLPLRLRVEPEKLPPLSRLTMAPAVLASVAVVPSTTLPPVAVAVMSALPVTEMTPALARVREPPSGTAPPPLRPAPVITVTSWLANWWLPTVPRSWVAGRVPLRLLAVLAASA